MFLILHNSLRRVILVRESGSLTLQALICKDKPVLGNIDGGPKLVLMYFLSISFNRSVHCRLDAERLAVTRYGLVVLN